MHSKKNYEWIKKKEQRRKILLSMRMPLTAMQIARKIRLGLDTCSSALVKMARMGIVNCLNPNSKNCRVYRLTEIGKEIQKNLNCESDASRPCEIIIPEGIAPLGIVSVIIQDGISKKQSIGWAIFCHVPIATADKVMLINHLICKRDVFCFIEPRHSFKLFVGWFVPHKKDTQTPLKNFELLFHNGHFG